MRRHAIVLSALALLWACSATVYLLWASSQTGIASSATLAASAGEATGMPPALATAEGVWMTGLLLGVTLLAGVPLGVAWSHPPGQRRTAWTVAPLVLGFCLVSGSFVGPLYLPTAILLMVAGAAGTAGPAVGPIGEPRA